MKAFFIFMIVIGALFMLLEWNAGRHGDSVPTELARLGDRGLGMALLGIVGFLCVWWFP